MCLGACECLFLFTDEIDTGECVFVCQCIERVCVKLMGPNAEKRF